MANFNLDDYVTVNQRVEKFYKDYPLGTIETEVISNIDSKVIIKASVYRCQDDNKPCTGHAMEVEGTTYINKTSHIENCETSAVGRALAFMGYEIKKSIASREEVETAVTRQNEMEVKAATKKEPLNEELKPSARSQALYNIATSKGITIASVVSSVRKNFNKSMDEMTADEYEKVRSTYDSMLPKIAATQANGKNSSEYIGARE